MGFNQQLNRTFHELRVQYSTTPISHTTNYPTQGVTKSWRNMAANKGTDYRAVRNRVGYIIPDPSLNEEPSFVHSKVLESGDNKASILGKREIPAGTFGGLLKAAAPVESDVAVHSFLTVAADATLSLAPNSLTRSGVPSNYVNILTAPITINHGISYCISTSSPNQLGNFVAYFEYGDERFAFKKIGEAIALYQRHYQDTEWYLVAKAESQFEHMHMVGADKSIRRVTFVFDDQAPYDITGNLGSFSAFILPGSDTGKYSTIADDIRVSRIGFEQTLATPLVTEGHWKWAPIKLTALEMDVNDYGVGVFEQYFWDNPELLDDPITFAYPLYKGRTTETRKLTLDLYRTYLYNTDIRPEVSFDGGVTYLPCTGEDNTFTIAVPSTATNSIRVKFIFYNATAIHDPLDRLISYSVYQSGEKTVTSNTWVTLPDEYIRGLTIKDVITRDMDSTAASLTFFDQCGEHYVLGAREWVACRIQLRKADEDWFTIFQGYSQGSKYEIIQEASWGAESNLTPRMYTINLVHEIVAYKQVFNRVLKHFFATSRTNVEAYQADTSILAAFPSTPGEPASIKRAHTWKVVDVLAFIFQLMTQSGATKVTDFPDIPVRISAADDENNIAIEVGDNLFQKAETLLASYLPNFLYKDYETQKYKLGQENRLTFATSVGKVFFYNPTPLNGAMCTWPGTDVCWIVADNNSYLASPVAPKYNVVQVTGSAGLRTSGTLNKWSAVVFNPKSVKLAQDQAVVPDPTSIDYIGWPIEMVEYNTGFALLSRDNIEFRAMRYLEYKGIGRKHISFSGPVIVKAHETEADKFCLPRHFDMITLMIWMGSEVLERQVYINSADLTWEKGYIRMDYNVVEARI